MFAFMRLTTIVLSILVFAVVLAVCGEAGACGGCVHACCVKPDRAERRRILVREIVKACDKFMPAIARVSGLAAVASFDAPPDQSPVTLLSSKVAQLRI